MKLFSRLGFGLLTFRADPFSVVHAFTRSTSPRPPPTIIAVSSRSFHPTTRHSPLSMTESDPQMTSSDGSPPKPLNTEHSLLNKIGSTTSMVVAGTFYLVLAWKRDALMVSFFMGSISNGILSKILKKILKQERPAGLDESSLDLPPSDNGMPSSHAMSLGFIGTFTALQLPWTTIPLLIYIMISLMYRVRTNLHSVEQIVVGVILGSFNGIIWRSFCFGNNFLGINVMDWVSATFLNDQGLLPWYGLMVPALVGAAVVGSVERRVSRFLKSKPE